MTSNTSIHPSIAIPYKKSNFFEFTFEGGLNGANELKDKTEGTYEVLKFSNYVLTGLEACLGAVKPITLSLIHVTGGISIIEFFGDAIDAACYWINGTFIADLKAGRVCDFLGVFTITFVTIGSTILFLAELGFCTLDKITMTIGKIPVVGAVASIGLAPFLCFGAGIAYLFWAGGSIQQIVVAKNVHQRVKSSIDLVSRIIKAALSVFVGVSLVVPMAPVVTVPIIVSLGLIATGLGVTSFLYKYYNKNSFKE